MKHRYVLSLILLSVLFCIISFAVSGSIKSSFFSADSVFSAGFFKTVGKVLNKKEYSQFDINVTTENNNISYSVYTKDFESYFLESVDNFDFTILCDREIDEISAPWSVLNYIGNSFLYSGKYSKLYDRFFDIIEQNIADNAFSEKSSIVNFDGIKRKNNAVMLELKNDTSLVAAVRDFFISDDILDLVNIFHDNEVTSEQLEKIVGNVFTNDRITLVWKRDIVSSQAYNETISVNYNGNSYFVRVSDDRENGNRISSLSVCDADNTQLFLFKLFVNQLNERIQVESGDFYIQITLYDNQRAEITIKDEQKQTDISMSVSEDYAPKEEIYDTSLSQEKGRMFCEILPWLYGNDKAALLFRTYEVELKSI